MNLLRIRNSCDIYPVLYQDGFCQSLYLDAPVYFSEYAVEQDAVDKNDGSKLITYSLWEKCAVIIIAASQHLLDALYHATLCNELTLIDEFGDTHIVSRMEVTHEWSDEATAKTTIKLFGEQINKMAEFGDRNTGTSELAPINDCIPIVLITAAYDTVTLGAFFADPWGVGTPFLTTDIGNLYLIGDSTDGKETITNAGIYELTFTIFVRRAELEFFNTYYGDAIDSIDKWYNENGIYYQTPHLESATWVVGNTYLMEGYCAPDTFVQVQYSSDAINWIDDGAPMTGSYFNLNGYSITLPDANPYHVRLYNYSRECDYGDSDYITCPPA
jgi:hypothetical protein